MWFPLRRRISERALFLVRALRLSPPPLFFSSNVYGKKFAEINLPSLTAT